ncbi:Metallo-hydrolase/oxidoreductase [Hysterangium stoloniferum]|nr:Metallo-hydrolase/oxidoreductase [Hysterangium stoloniferum]
MLSSFNITFLGTASAQPSSTRNHSALALRLGSDVWLFDCGESTQKQIQASKGIKMGKINKIFITHTHGDHIFGLLPLMASCLNGAGGTVDGIEDPRAIVNEADDFEIYGPLGTRAYVRGGLRWTHCTLGGKFIVHELLFPHDPDLGEEVGIPQHASEIQGQNIRPDSEGIWRNIFKDSLLSVSAAPIYHSAPCIGYVVAESPIPGKIDMSIYRPHILRNKAPMSLLSKLQAGERVVLPDNTVLEPPPRRPGRRVAILGDTYDPSPIADLAANVDVLIHEATNAHLPGIDPNTKLEESFQSVEVRTKSRGHSTPQMAGAFARRINAKKLILNHFSARYRGDDDCDDEARKVMEGIRELAKATFGSSEVVCARDWMSFDVEKPAQ